MTFPIPESLKKYFGDPAIGSAVDALVDALDGTDIPEVSWEEAQNYHRALLMGAQVRADLADLLFRVWDASRGQTNPARLGGEYFEYEYASPAEIWNNRSVFRSYYRGGRPVKEGGQSDGLYVWLAPPMKTTLELAVWRWDQDENLAEVQADGADGLEGWCVEHDVDEDSNYLANQSVDIAEFRDNPCSILERFRHNACEMIDLLVQD